MAKNMLSYLKKNEDDKIINLLVFCLFTISYIVHLFVTSVRNFVVLPYKLDTLFIYGILGLIIIYSTTIFIKRIKFDSIIIYSVFMIASLFSILSIYDERFHDNVYKEYLITLIVSLLILNLPCYVLMRCVKDYRILLERLYIAPFIICICSIVMIIQGGEKVFIAENGQIQTYNQSIAYWVLPAAIISTSALFDKIRLLHIACSALALVTIFMMGARGPILCYILFIAIKVLLLLNRHKKRSQLMSIIAICFIVGLVAVNYYQVIIENLIEISKYLNFSTRLFEKILESSFFTDNTRMEIINQSFNILRNHPFTGVGIGNDRILLANAIGRSDFIGLYPHNIFVEILLQFGVFVGLLFIIFLIVIIFVALFGNQSKEYKDVYCIFMAVGLFQLFVSRSYLGSQMFFAFLGLSVNSLYINKCKRTNNDSQKKMIK